MRERPYIHVAGPPGVGKTLFIERVLSSCGERYLLGAVRGELIDDLTHWVESRGEDDPELARYRRAGVMFDARFRFPREGDFDSFWRTEFINEYSEGIVIEGDLSEGVFPDLPVFVARPLADGEELLCRKRGLMSGPQARLMERLGVPVGGWQALLGVLMAEIEPCIEHDAGDREAVLGRIEGELRAKLKGRKVKVGLPERWAVADDYEGIETARLLMVNVRGDHECEAAQRVIDELDGIRKDKELFWEVAGPTAKRWPITAVVADLSNPKDPGLKKALARVKRALRSGR